MDPQQDLHLTPHFQPFINRWKWWFPTISCVKIGFIIQLKQPIKNGWPWGSRQKIPGFFLSSATPVVEAAGNVFVVDVLMLSNSVPRRSTMLGVKTNKSTGEKFVQGKPLRFPLRMVISVVVSNIFYFHPYLGKIPNFDFFQMGWNHQPVIFLRFVWGDFLLRTMGFITIIQQIWDNILGTFSKHRTWIIVICPGICLPRCFRPSPQWKGMASFHR